MDPPTPISRFRLRPITALLNTFLLIVELVGLEGLALYFHARSPRYGLAPLIIFLSALVTLLHSTGATPDLVTVVGGMRVVASDATLVPVIFVGLLLLYEMNGTAAARVTILGLIGVSALVLTIQSTVELHEFFAAPGSVTALTSARPAASRAIWVTGSSVLSFAAGFVWLVVSHQTLRARLPQGFLPFIPGVVIISALCLDTVLFRTLAFIGQTPASSLHAALATRVVGGLVVWPMVGAYLAKMRPRFPGATALQARSPFDLLFGSFERQEEILRSTEELSRAREVQLKTVVGSAPVILFALDTEGVFTLSEGAGLAVLGVSPRELIGRPVRDLFPTVSPYVDRAAAGESFRAIVDTGPYVFDTSFNPIRTEEGVVGVMGVATDVTIQSRAEAALEDSEERFRRTFEEAAVGLAHTTPQGVVLLVNAPMCTILARAGHELVGRPFSDFVHPHDRVEYDSDQARVNHATADTLNVTGDRRLVREDGEVVWTRLSLSSVKDDEGRSKYCIVVAEDVTDRRATEAQLRQAQKMEAVGQLTGGIAHDFNNLLTVISGSVELALTEEEGAGNGETRQVLNDALAAANRGAALTQHLLAFSRKQTLQPQSIDPAWLLPRMSELLQRTLGSSITVGQEIAPGTPPLSADTAQLEAAILNLAINSRDALGGTGSVKLEARERSFSAAEASAHDVAVGSYVEISVHDDGPGISADILDRVFEPFFSTKEPGKGTGLGLSMVYGFVRQSGGTVEIESAPGSGTRVRLLLPSDAAEGGRLPVAAAAGVDTGPRLNILLVEDDPGVCRVAAAMLTQLGHRVVTAGDRPAARAILEAGEALDLVFTDVVLPNGETGVDVAHDVSALRPGTPVLYASGYSGTTLTNDGILPDGVRLLPKPYRRPELVAAIRELLAENSAGPT